MQAAWTGNVSRYLFLLERGADVEAVEVAAGESALMLACYSGHCEAARLLVEHGGASANAAMTNDGVTALIWARQEGHLEIL